MGSGRAERFWSALLMSELEAAESPLAKRQLATPGSGGSRKGAGRPRRMDQFPCLVDKLQDFAKTQAWGASDRRRSTTGIIDGFRLVDAVHYLHCGRNSQDCMTRRVMSKGCLETRWPVCLQRPDKSPSRVGDLPAPLMLALFPLETTTGRYQPEHTLPGPSKSCCKNGMHFMVNPTRLAMI